MKRSQNCISDMLQYILRFCCCFLLLHMVSKDVSIIFNHYSFSSCCAVCAQSLSHVQLLGTPWTVARQAPLSMGFSRQESWSGQPFPSPEDLPNPGTKPRSPSLQADSLLSEPTRKPKNIRVGCLFLLQGIFLTPVPNWDLLHCRQILYQLRYQGNLSFLI